MRRYAANHGEDVLTFTIPPPRGVPCPACGGHGRHANGWAVIGYAPDGGVSVRSELGTPCASCNGRGRVKDIVVVPLDEENNP